MLCGHIACSYPWLNSFIMPTVWGIDYCYEWKTQCSILYIVHYCEHTVAGLIIHLVLLTVVIVVIVVIVVNGRAIVSCYTKYTNM